MSDSHAPLTLSVIRRLDELAQYEDAWNALAWAAPQQSPMLGYAWVAAHLEHRLPAGASWLVVVATRVQKLVGVLPLLITPLRVLGLTRQKLSTPYDGHTNSGDALIDAQAGDEVLPKLFAAAFDAVPDAVSLTVTRTPQASPTVSVAASEKIPLMMAEVDSRGAYLLVPENFDTYRSGLGRNFRSNLNKAANKLAKLPGVEYQFMRGADAAVADLERLIAVEASNWKGQAGSSIASDPATIAFYSRLVRNLAYAGWLEWHFLKADGKTIAGNLCMRFADSVVLWKLGYDEQYASCSPGGMVMQELLKRACETRDTREINLTTDQPWYSNWQMVYRDYFNVTIVKRSPIALLGVWLPAALRRAAKKSVLVRRLVDALRARRAAPAVPAAPKPDSEI